MKMIARNVLFAALMLFGINSYADELKLVTLEFPPYEYTENGEVKGTAVEVVKEAFKRMGQPIKINAYPWARAIKMIEDGEADAIFTAYKTPERELFADYSKENLMPQIVSLFVKKDSKIVFDGDLGKLSAHKIGIVRSLSYGDKVDTALKNKVFANVEEVPEGPPNFLKLISSRVDIVPSNKYVALDILTKLKKTDEVKELAPEVQSIPSYIAFSKKKNLAKARDSFDETLKKMKSDGTYDKIISDYFKAHK
jgi:polar amino acid transport system substrate-binding protein